MHKPAENVIREREFKMASGKKILLFRPYNRTSMLIPNHGLGYLAAALRNSGYDVELTDCIRERMTHEMFAEFIRDREDLLIGVQVFTFDLNSTAQHLKTIRVRFPDVPICLGGPHPSAMPEQTLKDFPEADFVFNGEADRSLPALAEKIAGGAAPGREDFSGIANLVWRRNGEFVHNEREVIEDLDSLGMPAWDLIDPLSYPLAPQGTFLKKVPFAPIIVTRGCPFKCTFCAGYIIGGRRLRSRSVENVIDEIEYLVKNYGIKEIHIQDDNFTFYRDFVVNFCQSLLKKNLGIVWACPNGVRLDTLDEEVLRLMEDSGCWSIAVGIESGSQRILKLMKKNLTLDKVREKLALIRKTTRIRVTGFFILGYPSETPEEMKKTVDFSLKLDIDKVNFGILMPLPGTEVTRLLQKKGLLGDDIDWSRMSEYRSPYTPPGFTEKSFRKIFQKAFFRFYFRPHIIYRFLGEIRSWDQVKILWNRFKDVFEQGKDA